MRAHRTDAKSTKGVFEYAFCRLCFRGQENKEQCNQVSVMGQDRYDHPSDHRKWVGSSMA